MTRKIGDDTVTFIWTAAHVVDGLAPRHGRYSARHAQDSRRVPGCRDCPGRQQDGRRVGEVKYDCKIIKVSDADYGEDLARADGPLQRAYPLNVCAKFHKDPNYIPPIGVELSHCGSLLGPVRSQQLHDGRLESNGAHLAMKGANVKVFDQVTAVAFPGSSGGGMFLKENGEYIGMLTQGVMKLQGFNFIVPVRRIHAWSKDAKIEWAINPDVPMPTLKEIDAIPVEDAGQSPGGYPQHNPAGGLDEGGPPPSSHRSTSTTRFSRVENFVRCHRQG